MNIAICEDEKIIRETVSCYCQKYGIENNIELNIIEFTNGEEVLEYNLYIDLLFLDIGLPGISGIEVKNHIVKTDNINYIAFVSGYKDRVWEAFSKKTLGFINKPIMYEKICEMISNCNKAIEYDISIDISMGNCIIPVKVSSIIHINAQNVYSKVITNKEAYLVRESLTEWEIRLKNYSFFRIHKSNLVNMEYIRDIEKGYVILDNGTKLKIGRTKIQSLKKENLEWRKKNAR